MDSNLLANALNQHGQQFMQALETYQDSEKLSDINMKAINYSQYTERAKKFKFEDRIRRQKLYEFMARKADMLFAPVTDAPKSDVKYNQGLWTCIPPLESLMYVPMFQRRQVFYEDLKVGSIIVGKILSLAANGLTMSILALEDGKKRQINDLALKAFCPQIYTPPGLTTEKIGDFVRGVVVKIDPTLEKIHVNLNANRLNIIVESDLLPGFIQEEELPRYYKKMLSSEGLNFETILQKSRSFYNPTSCSHLWNTWNKPWESTSLIPSLDKKNFKPEDYAEPLRKLQNKGWAYYSVKEGVSHFKSGKQTEALQCLNKALLIDEENVEAYVARGALFANNSNFIRAVEDFEKALEFNPQHANGKKYLAETLVALSKVYQEKKEWDAATKVLNKVLRLDPNNILALQALQLQEQLQRKEQIKAHEGTSPGRKQDATSPKEEELLSTRSKILQLLENETRKEKTETAGTSKSSSNGDFLRSDLLKERLKNYYEQTELKKGAQIVEEKDPQNPGGSKTINKRNKLSFKIKHSGSKKESKAATSPKNNHSSSETEQPQTSKRKRKKKKSKKLKKKKKRSTPSSVSSRSSSPENKRSRHESYSSESSYDRHDRRSPSPLDYHHGGKKDYGNQYYQNYEQNYQPYSNRRRGYNHYRGNNNYYQRPYQKPYGNYAYKNDYHNRKDGYYKDRYAKHYDDYSSKESHYKNDYHRRDDHSSSRSRSRSRSKSKSYDKDVSDSIRAIKKASRAILEGEKDKPKIERQPGLSKLKGIEVKMESVFVVEKLSSDEEEDTNNKQVVDQKLEEMESFVEKLKEIKKNKDSSS